MDQLHLGRNIIVEPPKIELNLHEGKEKLMIVRNLSVGEHEQLELPMLFLVLPLSGRVTRENLREYRKHAICIILILAAIITPTGDPFSLMVCSVPLYVLYEFSIFMCRKESQQITDEE